MKLSLPFTQALLASLLVGISFRTAKADCSVCPDETSNVEDGDRLLSEASKKLTGVESCGGLAGSAFFTELNGAAACRTYQSRIGIGECGCEAPLYTCSLCGFGVPIADPEILIGEQSCGELQGDILLETTMCSGYQKIHGEKCGCEFVETCPMECPDGTNFASDTEVEIDGATMTCSEYARLNKYQPAGVDCDAAKLAAAQLCGCEKASEPCSLCAEATSRASDDVCAEEVEKISYLPASSPLCNVLQITAVGSECGCTEVPEIPDGSVAGCSLCPDGSYPVYDTERPKISSSLTAGYDTQVSTCGSLFHVAHYITNPFKCQQIQSFATQCGCGVDVPALSPVQAPTDVDGQNQDRDLSSATMIQGGNRMMTVLVAIIVAVGHFAL